VGAQRAQSALVSSADPIHKLEHDHVPLGQMILSLQESLESAARGAQSPHEIYTSFSDALAEVREELLEHFAQEEEGLFPLLLRELPDLNAEVDAVQAAHDGVCGAVARLSYLVQRGPACFVEQFAQVRSLFERFETAYALHAREERALLRRADERLDAGQRQELAGLLEGL
jgi:hypothetical protein